jgi:hypothetical protein
MDLVVRFMLGLEIHVAAEISRSAVPTGIILKYGFNEQSNGGALRRLFKCQVPINLVSMNQSLYFQNLCYTSV